jgi:hypothetical protein
MVDRILDIHYHPSLYTDETWNREVGNLHTVELTVLYFSLWQISPFRVDLKQVSSPQQAVSKNHLYCP